MFDLFRAFRGAPERKSGSGGLLALSLGGAARWGGRDTAALARSGVMQNAVAYACVRKIASAAASVPWLLYDGAAELESHPLLSLLARPNPNEDGASLFERWYAFLQSAGNAYLETVTLEGAPRELHVLRPDRMAVVPGARGWPAAYDYTVDGRATRIARDPTGFLPVLHLALFHPLDDYYGLSPLAVAGTALEVHNAGAAWSKALLDNAARPSGALIYKGADGSLTEDQFARLKRELEDAYQGSANAGRPMVLEGGLDWKAMSLAPADMDFAETRAQAAREIALAFGVPPMLLGLPGDNTYANYAEANLSFWRQTVLPLVGRSAAANEASIASAATCDIGAAGSLFLEVTGTTTITSLGSGANLLRFLRFAGALTLTHDATSLVLPGAANIVTAAGDTALFSSDGSGHWRCRHYSRADGQPLAADLTPASVSAQRFQGKLVGTVANGGTLTGVNKGVGGGLFVIHGGIAFNEFVDLVLFFNFGGTVVVGSVGLGSCPARTYSLSGSGFDLVLASGGAAGTYQIGVTILAMA